MTVYLGTEDELSERVGIRIIEHLVDREIEVTKIAGRGYGGLKQKMPSFIELAKRHLVVIITDLDNFECATELKNRRFQLPADVPEDLVFRVAIKEIEAWLLADRSGFSKFAGVSIDRVSRENESIPDPKEYLINCVRRGKKPNVKRQLLPDRGSGSKQGLGYNDLLGEFVEKCWNLERARECSDSLDRACNRIGEKLDSPN